MAKTTTNDGRVNTTFVGYILIGFMLLLIGVFGLQTGNLFGDDVMNWPESIQVISWVSSVAGMILILLTVFAYRTGEKTSAVIFALTGFTLIVLHSGAITGIIANSNWFLYIALAVLYLVLAINAILEGEYKMLSILLIVMAVMFVFLGLSSFYDCIIPGPGNDEGLFHLMGIIYAIFAFVGFGLATYLGLAFSHPKKLPAF